MEEAIALWFGRDYIAPMSDHNPGLRPWRDISRRTSRQIMVGSVPVGGNAPISVQTMTNTLTSDVKATVDQIRRCEEAGVDIIRVSCPDVESTAKAMTAELGPVKIADTLAFMFESRAIIQTTQFAMTGGLLQDDYDACWAGFPKATLP